MKSSSNISRRTLIKQSATVLAALALPIPLNAFSTYNLITETKNYNVIIIGGSYSGLSAAMALGRALRKLLIIDSGKPCNAQTPHSHNFITQDGETPKAISEKAKSQVLEYKTVTFLNDLAIDASKSEEGFNINTKGGQTFTAGQLIFASGVKDRMPNIEGFAECWGISVIHCPYCHRYEVKQERTEILANDDAAYHYAQLIRNWTDDLTIFTNSASTLTQEQTDTIKKHHIKIVKKEISILEHNTGHLEEIVFKDSSKFPLKAMYARPDFEQHCKLPEQLGCELTEQGHIKVDMLQNTTVPNISTCGDCSTPIRAVSFTVAMGTVAGAAVNNKMAEKEFREI